MGDGSGKITLIQSSNPFELRSFVTKQQRAVLSLDWSTFNESLILCGYDKVRSSCSGMIWDVSSGTSIQLLPCEGPAYLKWIPRESNLLACSSPKQIRIIDSRIRDSYEIEFSPYSSIRDFLFECSELNSTI